LSSPDQTGNHDSNGDIAQDDEGKLALLEENAILAKVEMTDLSSLRTIVLLSGQVEKEVSRPAEKLMDDAVNQNSNWRVLG